MLLAFSALSAYSVKNKEKEQRILHFVICSSHILQMIQSSTLVENTTIQNSLCINVHSKLLESVATPFFMMLSSYKHSSYKAFVVVNKLLTRLGAVSLNIFKQVMVSSSGCVLLFRSHWKEKQEGGWVSWGGVGLLVFPGRKVWSSLFGSEVPGAVQCLAWWPCDCLQRNLMSSPAELCSKVSFHLSSNLWTLKLWAMELQLCQYTTN